MSRKPSLSDAQEQLKHLGHLSQEIDLYFKKKMSEIDTRTLVNNNLSKSYLELKERRQNDPEILQMGIDILAETDQINYLKFVVVQELLEDMYERIGFLGKQLSMLLEMKYPEGTA